VEVLFTIVINHILLLRVTNILWY